MGSILRFDLNKIREEFRTDIFFETGTWRGDGVEYARQYPFELILSAEIVPELAQAARQRFEGDRRVRIIEGPSVTALQQGLGGLDSNCVFWLDAHFPGADEGLTRYDAETDETVRLPLSSEIQAIWRMRQDRNDVFIMDDLRIYEDGPFENGNVPEDAKPKFNRNLDFLELLRYTHVIQKSYRDEGYLVVVPRRKQ